MFEKVRRWNNPFWASVGQILPYWATERLDSIFHKQYAHSTLVNRRNWVWKRSKKRWRPTSFESVGLAKEGLQTITSALFQVRFSQTRRLRWDKKKRSFQRCFWIRSATKNDKVMVVQRGLHNLKRSTSLEWSWLDGWEEEVTGGINIANGLDLHEVTGASSCRREQASKSRHDDGSSKGGPSAEAGLSAGNSWSSTTLQISFARFTAK